MLASEWKKIGHEEPYISRCGEVNDEIGSKIIAARLVQSIMRLCFLMEKEYTPYSKWFGTAFSRLKCSKKLFPVLNKILASNNWKEREKFLAQAYEIIAQMHNNLKITKSLPAKVSKFHDRPYKVVNGELFTREIGKKIQNPIVRVISANIGSADQLTNNDLTEDYKLVKKLKNLYK